MCPNVQVLDKDLLRLHVPGDDVLLLLKGTGDKKIPNGELKKLITPLAKEV